MGRLNFYIPPLAQGIEEVVPYDSSLFRERFAHLNIAGPVIVPLPEAAGSESVMSILGDLVATFGIREIAVPDRYRAETPALTRLHSRASDGILLLQSLEEDVARPSTYKLARATLLPEDHAPEPASCSTGRSTFSWYRRPLPTPSTPGDD